MKRIKYFLLILAGVVALTSCDYFFEKLGIIDKPGDNSAMVGTWTFDSYECYALGEYVETVAAGSPARFIYQAGGETQYVAPDDIWSSLGGLIFNEDGTCKVFGNDCKYAVYSNGRVQINGVNAEFQLSGDILSGRIGIADASAYQDSKGAPYVGGGFYLVAIYKKR